MAKDTFIINPGIYHVPNFGRVDCNKLPNRATLVKLYLNKSFSSFITPTKEGVALLKKEKLEPKHIVQLIHRAKTPDEVDWLLEVKSNKLVKNIAETRKKALQENS